jgi:hypothetical protein
MVEMMYDVLLKATFVMPTSSLSVQMKLQPLTTQWLSIHLYMVQG